MPSNSILISGAFLRSFPFHPGLVRPRRFGLVVAHVYMFNFNRFSFMNLTIFRLQATPLRALGVGGILVATLALPLAAASQKGKKKSTSPSGQVRQTATKGNSLSKGAGSEKEPPMIDILTGIRAGQLAATAEGRSDGRQDTHRVLARLTALSGCR